MVTSSIFQGDPSWSAPSAQPAVPSPTTCLVDLGFPCHLACLTCWRPSPPSPAALDQARGHLLNVVAHGGARELRAIFLGGDPFCRESAFVALVEEAERACRAAGTRFEGVLLSDGTSWSGPAVQHLHALGVRRAQVTLEGGRAVHDRLRPMKGGGASFDAILRSLRLHRGALDVVVRLHAATGPEVEEVAQELARAGLFAGPHPVRLYAGAPEPYREQARDLVRLLDAAGAPGT